MGAVILVWRAYDVIFNGRPATFQDVHLLFVFGVACPAVYIVLRQRR